MQLPAMTTLISTLQPLVRTFAQMTRVMWAILGVFFFSHFYVTCLPSFPLSSFTHKTHAHTNTHTVNLDVPKPVVIDSGSFLTRAGIAGDEGPRIQFRSVVGKKGEELCFGESAIFDESTTDLCCPIDRDTVTSWDNLEKVKKKQHVSTC